MVAKIVSRSELLSIRESLRESGKRVVFTNGCFDLLHRGHVEMLMEARSCGDVLFVGLNSDKGVRALKGLLEEEKNLRGKRAWKGLINIPLTPKFNNVAPKIFV